jgi:hypothetical protein
VNQALERLLQAHVRHELAQLQGEQLDRSVERGVTGLFAWAQTVTLEEVVTPAQINGVIQRYVIELRVSGGITELTGELSRLVLQSRRSATTRVGEILAPASYADFAEKLTGLEGVRRVFIEKLAHSVTFSAINTSLMARSLLDMLTPALLRQPGRLAAGLSAVWEPLARSLRPDLERRLAELLGQYLEQHRERVTRDVEKRLLHVLNPDNVRSLLDEVWDGVANMQLSEAFSFIGEQDLEDFVVLVHEFWLRYRKTDFFRHISGEMVAHFFAKYGNETLTSLVDDMGVSQAMVSSELIGFLRPVLEHASDSGALEHALRAKLSEFYASGAALAALENAAGPL